MSGDSEAVEALVRAGRRAFIHLVKAGIEGLKAMEAIIDELARLGDRPAPDGPQRIEIE